MNNYLKTYAAILSAFLLGKEDKKEELRYIFRGFELMLVKEISAVLGKKGIPVSVISLYEEYENAIKSRAASGPAFVWIANRQITEYSSLSSTYKSMSNVFYPFSSRKERVEGVYDLYDVSEWLFAKDQLSKIPPMVMTQTECAIKKEILDRSLKTLQTIWNHGESNPCIRNRLSPGLVANVLASIASLRDFDFNNLATITGLEPCLTLQEDENTLQEYISNWRKVTPLLKGSDIDRKAKFAKMGENVFAGLALFNHSENRSHKDLEALLGLLREKDAMGRRVWVVRSSDVEVRDCSFDSGITRSVLLRIRNRKTKKTYVFKDEWSEYLSTKEELQLFMNFLGNRNIVGKKHNNKSPFSFVSKGDKIVAIFEFLEAYMLGMKNFRKEIDEIQIQSNTRA